MRKVFLTMPISVLMLVMLLGIGIFSAAAVENVQQGTPLTPANAGSIQEVARFGRGEVFGFAAAADGSTIAVASSLGVWLYPANDLGTAADPPLIASENPADVIAISLDGQMVAFADDRLVRVWNISGNSEMFAFDIGGNSQPRALAFSPDTSRLAAGYSDDMLRLWDLTSGALVSEGIVHDGDVNAIVYTPNGAIIVTASQDGTVKTWDAASGAPGLTLSGHSNDVNALAINADATLLASASDDDSVRIWDLNSGAILQVLAGHERDVNAVAFSPDGVTVVSGGEDEVIRLWNATTGVQQGIIPAQGQDILGLAINPGGDLIFAVTNAFSTNGGVSSWSTTGALQATSRGHADAMRTVAFNPDGSLLGFSNNDGILWTWNTSQPAVFSDVPAFERAITASAENRTQLDFAPNGSYGVTSLGNSVLMADPVTGQVLRILDPGFSSVESIAISPDSSLLAAVGSDGGVAVFDANTGQRLAFFSAHTDDVVSVAFSPDQRVIATASLDGTVRLWGIAAR